MQQFARDMAERPYISRIEEDLKSGIRSGVRGTPTFFINGVLYPGSWEQEALLAGRVLAVSHLPGVLTVVY